MSDPTTGQLQAISPIDGRYRTITEPLAEYFSEYGLIHKRIIVECEYLIALSDADIIRAFTADEKRLLRSLADLSIKDAEIVKKIEQEGYGEIPATNHDVKAIGYFLKMKFKETSLRDVLEWIHFGLTSEDVNSVAYGFALRSSLAEIMLPALGEITGALRALAMGQADTRMLARTHGQPASPTTFGKEMRVFEARLARQMKRLKEWTILVKFGGATGNWNAHVIAFPDADWLEFGKRFIEGLNEGYEILLELNPITTQIESHDTYAELFDTLRRINVILTDLSQDMWRYISDGWIRQKQKEGEVGSSTMPHKINPIDFENAEGNLGVASALFEHYCRKLPISRLQRDLSDSTVERTFGTAFAHALIGFKSLMRGLEKIEVNAVAMLEDLKKHPEVLAEATQTVLRREGADMPYEKLKTLTRGREITLEELHTFIDGLSIGDDVKERLKSLRPENYIGLAADTARQ